MNTIAFDSQDSSNAPIPKVETEPYNPMDSIGQAQKEPTPASESAEIQEERRLRRKQRRQRKSDRHLDRERQLLADMESYTRGMRQRVEGQTKRLHRRERLARKEELERLRRVIGPSVENYMERPESEGEESSSTTSDASEVSELSVIIDPEICFSRVKKPGMTKVQRRIRHLCRYYVTESLKSLAVRTGYEYKKNSSAEERQLASHHTVTLVQHGVLR
jgi:hypothetical protein